ncbi:hypothetical protein [Methylobacterium nigriterrae]
MFLTVATLALCSAGALLLGLGIGVAAECPGGALGRDAGLI